MAARNISWIPAVLSLFFGYEDLTHVCAKSDLAHQDVGQIDIYITMYDEMYRKDGHNPTIGLLFCSETSSDIEKYSVLHDNDHLFAAKYLTYLSLQHELQNEIQKQKEIYMVQHGGNDTL